MAAFSVRMSNSLRAIVPENCLRSFLSDCYRSFPIETRKKTLERENNRLSISCSSQMMSLKSEKELTFACVDNSRVFDCFHLSIALSFFSNKNWLCPVSPCQLQWHMQLIPRTGWVAIFQQMHSISVCIASIRSRTGETHNFQGTDS